MTNRDGNLRHTFRVHLPQAQWSSIETGATEGGVPDSEYIFPDGTQGWIEFKCVRRGQRPVIRPAQIAWISRRWRCGGRVHIAVLQQWNDMLHLVSGQHVVQLAEHGLGVAGPRTHWWVGKPSQWWWDEIEDVLRAEGPQLSQWTPAVIQNAQRRRAQR